MPLIVAAHETSAELLGQSGRVAGLIVTIFLMSLIAIVLASLPREPDQD